MQFITLKFIFIIASSMLKSMEITKTIMKEEANEHAIHTNGHNRSPGKLDMGEEN